MKQLLVFIRKEFYHVFRDKRTLLIMFGLPVVQIALFGFALTSEVKNARVIVCDNAHDINSEQLTAKLKTSSYFTISEKILSPEEIDKAFKKGNVNCVVIFPQHFGSELKKTGKGNIQIIADGSDPNTAKTLINYLTANISGYQQELNQPAIPTVSITTQTRMLYNETQNGSLNFIPGVMALILMIVCTALTSVAIVKEKETGTMEILLVSPFKPAMVLVAKAIPYLILSLINFTLIVILTVTALDVQIQGSLLLLFAETTLFIIVCLSFGLLISNITSSQQTALLLSMMGMMLPTIIFTGFLFPLENMPLPFRVISQIVPSKWYYSIIKSVMLRGLGFSYVWKETLVLVMMTVILLTIARRKFKIRLQ